MFTFSQFLTEALVVEKLKHLEHVEDHIFNSGHEGVSHAAGTLSDVIKFLSGEKSNTRITTKFDGCIHKDTKILMSDGSVRTIEDLIEKWSLANRSCVVGVDEQDNLVECEVVDVLRTITEKDWIQINLADGESILLTEDHEVMTKEGWKAAKDLTAGDDIRNIDSYK